MPSRSRRPESLPPKLRTRLESAREALLDVHKALLDEERAGYERTQGAIDGSYYFLQLVIGDPWFAWLRPMSGLVVAIDEQLTSREVVPPADAEFLLGRARALLTPVENEEGFGGRFHQSLQSAPAVALRHAEAMKRFREA